jgi:hypothetical protein
MRSPLECGGADTSCQGSRWRQDVQQTHRVSVGVAGISRGGGGYQADRTNRLVTINQYRRCRGWAVDGIILRRCRGSRQYSSSIVNCFHPLLILFTRYIGGGLCNTNKQLQISIDGQLRLDRSVRLQTDNFRLFLRQQTDKRQPFVCTMSGQ